MSGIRHWWFQRPVGKEPYRDGNGLRRDRRHCFALVKLKYPSPGWSDASKSLPDLVLPQRYPYSPILQLGCHRHYYVAAEDATWDYAPSKRDLMHGAPLPMPWGQQTQWPKTRFIEYTDSNLVIPRP